MELLLDTHTWIWLNNADSELKPKIIKLIDQAAVKGAVYIPIISIWELSTLVTKKRITLRTSIKQWVNEALSQHGVNLAALTPDIAIESTQLPNQFHGDPADRIIVATARLNHLTILTRDKKILDYAEAGFVQAISV